MALALGQKFVDVTKLYSLGEFIGGGGFGRVYKAIPKNKDVQNLGEAAIKILLHPLEKADEEAAFLTEVSILCYIQFRSVHRLFYTMRSPPEDIPIEWQEKLRVKGFGPAIVTQFMPNGDSQSIIKQYIQFKEEQRPDREIAPIATKLMKIIYGTAEGMAVLHSNNVIHSDLKPENVFLNENDEPVVSDFGLSTKVDPGMKYKQNGRSLYYWINDQPRSFPYDVYSYSIFLLACFSPVKKLILNSGEYLKDKISSNYKWGEYLKDDSHRCQKPDLMPEPLYNLAKRCWRTNPDERLTFVEIVDILKDPSMWIPGTDTDQMNQYIFSPEVIMNPARLSEPNEGKIAVPKPTYLG